ncbi:hypothetical protein [Bordetella sp. LUAb4]|uniref:hypothetical protein n=1 Tax=Bordetella sp. LUAb4 TaxID=2843195 RepID=UPI001E2A8D8A|nr:hypothetical protein [Bordetella sp. LUAb4]
MFSSTTSAGTAAPMVPLGDDFPVAVRAGTLGAIAFEAQAGTSRAGSGQGPTSYARTVDMAAGVPQDPAHPMRASLAGQSGESPTTAQGLGLNRDIPLDDALVEALLDSDIDWASLIKYWEIDVGELGPTIRRLSAELKGLPATLRSAAALAKGNATKLAKLRATAKKRKNSLQEDIQILAEHRIRVVKNRLADDRTKALVGFHNRELWNRFVEELFALQSVSDDKIVDLAFATARRAMEYWAGMIGLWEGVAQQVEAKGGRVELAEFDAFAIQRMARKVELLLGAQVLENQQLLSKGSHPILPLDQTTIGKGALRRAKPLLHARLAVQDTSTAMTWFKMVSMDRKRPGHSFINHFSPGIIQFHENCTPRNAEYYLSHVVLYQLLSLKEMDPANITTLEFVDVGRDVLSWLAIHASAPQGIGSGITWQHVPVARFVNDTPQGGLAREIAHALGKEIRQAWCIDYLPSAAGAPALEGQAATASAQEMRADILLFIASAPTKSRPKKSKAMARAKAKLNTANARVHQA